MSDLYIPQSIFPKSRFERLVAGLRDSNFEKPIECRVFKANPDGTKGELLRIEKPRVKPIEYNQPYFDTAKKK